LRAGLAAGGEDLLHTVLKRGEVALWIHSTGITDLTPLQGVPLEDISLAPRNITRGRDILRGMKTLKSICIGWNQSCPAVELWEGYE
jgi:hypothetical protein